jgi:hypothetical protein
MLSLSPVARLRAEVADSIIAAAAAYICQTVKWRKISAAADKIRSDFGS